MNFFTYDVASKKFSHRNKNISLETFLQNSNSGDVLYINATLSVSNQDLEVFYSQIQNCSSQIRLVVKSDQSYIDDEKEMAHLQELGKFCLSKNIKFNIELKNEGAEYQKFVIAKQKIDEFIANLKTFEQKRKNEGRELSVIEKYFIVYKFVANRVYNEDKENFLNEDMRTWIGVLSTGYVICSGFASLLKCVCDRAFSPDELKCYEQSCSVYDGDDNLLGAHALNIVRIRDKKYNYNGLLNSDSCWGSNKENGEGKFNYCLNPLSVYGMIPDRKFTFRELWFYKDIENVGYNEEIDFYCYNEPELYADVLKENGLKPLAQLKDETNIEEQLKNKEKKNKSEKRKKKKEAIVKAKKFLDKYNLGEFSQIQLPTLYPQSVKEQFPLLQEFQDLFSSKQAPAEEEFAKVLKQVLEFYNANIELFNKLKEKLKSLGLDLINSIGEICEYRFKEDLENFSEYDEKKKLEKQIQDSYLQEYETLTKCAGDIIRSKPIPHKALVEGLRAVAEFSGMNNEKVEQYIEKEMEKIKTFKAELVSPKQETKNVNA